MGFLQRLQLAEKRVELSVGDDRRIPHVVAELVVADLLGQVGPFALHVGVIHDMKRSRGV